MAASHQREMNDCWARLAPQGALKDFPIVRVLIRSRWRIRLPNTARTHSRNAYGKVAAARHTSRVTDP
jgi:hypothetical protein